MSNVNDPNRDDIIALHEQNGQYAFPDSRRSLTLRLRLQRGDWREVLLHFKNKNREEDWQTMPLSRYSRDSMLDYYEVRLETERATRYLAYCFSFRSEGGELRYLSYHGLRRDRPGEGFFEYLYTTGGDVLSVPDWAKGITVYQIFPDRFCRAEASPDVPGLMPWGSPPEREGFFGGNLRGILQRLDYLADLGVDAVYLNPIFKAPSNHRYDTEDYLSIDPLLGDARDAAALAEGLHDRGIRVLLDGVFNHCGYTFPIFQHVLKNGNSSPYRDWFCLDGFPVDPQRLNYETAGYYHAMPKLNQSNPDVREYCIRVAEHWTRELRLDGWRLDVSDEVDRTLWRELRKRLTAINPEILLIGEAWQENTELSGRGLLHGVIDYPFYRACRDFFSLGKLTPGQFSDRIGRALGVRPPHVRHTQVNMLGCHDTERISTLCGEDEERLRCAFVYLFTMPGIPLLYYGDEAGLPGGGDPDCRRTMPWESALRSPLRDFIQKLIGLRRRCPTLRLGDTVCLEPKDGLVSHIRTCEAQRLFVAINMGDGDADADSPFAADAVDLLTGRVLPERFTLGRCQSVILLERPERRGQPCSF